MTVAEIMTRNLAVLQADDRVSRALRVLEEMDVRHLPVLAGKRLVGILSERDLRVCRLPTAVEERDPDLAARLLAIGVTQIMSDDVISVYPHCSLKVAVDLMTEHKVGALTVMDPETRELVGLVSYIDVLNRVKPLLDQD